MIKRTYAYLVLALLASAAGVAPAEDVAKREVDAYIGPSEPGVPSNVIDSYAGLKRNAPVLVPKNLTDLSAQVGDAFRIEQRGNVLFATDLPAKDHTMLIDGIFACCSACLQHDFFPGGIRKPLTVYIFSSKTSYQNGLRAFFDMDPVSPYGHYGHSQKYIVINYETGPGTLVHELTHAMMASDFPGAPIWISEGMASLYEQCRVEGQSLKGDSNWRLPELQVAFTQNRLTPLKALLSLSSRQFRQENESLHYAESRYFCKYLEDRGKLRAVYARFRDTATLDPTGQRAIETVMGKPLSQVEADWHAWLGTQAWQGDLAAK